MNLLPHWVLTDNHPAFFDTDSGSAIEQTARVYGAMQALIKEYNSFVDNVNKAVVEIGATSKEEIECLKKCVAEMFSTHRQAIEIEIANQNLRIAQAEKYMKDNIGETAENLLTEQLSSGALTISLIYDEENETAFIVGVNNNDEINNILSDVVDGTEV